MQLISDGFWPGMSYDAALDLPYDVWASLALSCDERVADIERAQAQRGRH